MDSDRAYFRSDSNKSYDFVPEPWLLCIHPRGYIYFYNPVLRIVTDQDVRLTTVHDVVEHQYSFFPPSELDEEMEIHVHPQLPILSLVVNHRHCVAAYASEVDQVKTHNVPLLDPNTLNRRRRLYWNYMWSHPAHQTCPSRAITDAAEALTWFYTDNLISGSRSTVPFSKTECEELAKVVKEMSHHSHTNSTAKVVFLSWLLREICSFRDAENYGLYTQKELREMHEARSQKSLSNTERPFLLTTFMFRFLFFGIPWTYFTQIKKSLEFKGRLVAMQSNWQSYIERLAREYSQFLLIATVLLSATVGLLAVPGMSQVPILAATISTFASLASLIVGVFCIWRFQANTAAIDYFTYMRNIQHSPFGLHGHAMLLSLPAVLLVWAIVAFTVSMVVFATHDISAVDPFAKASAWVGLLIFVIVLAAVLAVLYTFSLIWSFQRRDRIWSWFRQWRTANHNRVGDMEAR